MRGRVRRWLRWVAAESVVVADVTAGDLVFLPIDRRPMKVERVLRCVGDFREYPAYELMLRDERGDLVPVFFRGNVILRRAS